MNPKVSARVDGWMDVDVLYVYVGWRGTAYPASTVH